MSATKNLAKYTKEKAINLSAMAQVKFTDFLKLKKRLVNASGQKKRQDGV